MVELVVDGAASGIVTDAGTGLNTGGEGVPTGGDDRADRLATAAYKTMTMTGL